VSRAIRCRTRRTGSCSASPSCEPLLDWALSRQMARHMHLAEGFPPWSAGHAVPPVPLRRNEASWADNGVLMGEIAGGRAEEIAGVDKPQLGNEIVQTITCPPACAILTLLHADCCLLGSSNWGQCRSRTNTPTEEELSSQSTDYSVQSLRQDGMRSSLNLIPRAKLPCSQFTGHYLTNRIPTVHPA
jgi:hypothetical protein